MVKPMIHSLLFLHSWIGVYYYYCNCNGNHFVIVISYSLVVIKIVYFITRYYFCRVVNANCGLGVGLG